MNFKEWYSWVKEIPSSQKWIVWFMLLAPTVSNLYWLRNYLGIFSPTYLFVSLVPVLSVYNLVFSKMKNAKLYVIDRLFLAYGVLTILSIVFAMVVLSQDIFYKLEIVLKMSFHVFLYFFFMRFIRCEKDIIGLLYTFYLSFIFIVFFFVYEFFLGGLSAGQGEYEGFRTQIFVYAFYVCAVFLLLNFFRYRELKENKSNNVRFYVLGALLFFMAFYVSQATAFIILAFVVILAVFYLYKLNFSTVLLGLFLILLFGLIENSKLTEILYSDIDREMAVLEGEKKQELLFHGRMGRWEMLMNQFYDFDPLQKVFGVFWGNKLKYSSYTNTSSHNDFIRILYMTGILGLVIYLSHLIVLLIKLATRKREYFFLGMGAFITFFGYSFTLTPTLYTSVLFFVYPVFIYLTRFKIFKS